MVDNEKLPQPTEAEQEWTKYIGAVDSYDGSSVDTERIWKDLTATSQYLFGSRTEVWFSEEQYDANLNSKGSSTSTDPNTSCGQKPTPRQHSPSRVLRSSDEVVTLVQGNKPSHRTVSLVRLHNKSEFRISLPSLLKILRHHEICPSFFDMFMSFRTTSAPAEKGDGPWSMRMQSGLPQVISYQFRYMEQGTIDGRTVWYECQMGVHQRLDSNSLAHGTTTVLHANDSCKVFKALHGQHPGKNLPSVRDRPFAVHSLVISSYLHNWRWYLDSIAHNCRQYENEYMTIKLEAVPKRLNFNDLRHARNIEGQLITVKYVLETTNRTLQTLTETVGEYKRLQRDEKIAAEPDAELDMTILKELEQRCRSFLASADEIYKRNEKLIQAMTDSVNISKQTTAERINQTVRTVTVITLTYLPAQFVATFFGTNFVLYNTNSGNIQVSRTIWIFVVCTVCLSLTTGVVWWISRMCAMRRDRGRNLTA